ncbi:MAG TPA: nucleoside triphosphate pyrophosphohydrolase [Gaiellales bacterium]|nr:nucleoside triphosphate pyrophosphohydrolase [Gaiellales bacterium]
MGLLVALGPGDPALVPLRSWQVLETAGPVEVPADEPLRGWLGEHGIRLEAGAPVTAASGERFAALLVAGGWDAVEPAGDALAVLLAGDALAGLAAITRRLRSDCPWDREQTVETIVPHTLEEAYEVADAARRGPGPALVDELGDLLFQVVFLALLCEEAAAGDLAAVAAGITAKLVRRHPHVFGDAGADTPAQVRSQWERIKTDQEGRTGIFHDVPDVLPALLRARKLQRRAAAVGFDRDAWDGAFGDLAEELRELREALDAAPASQPEREPDGRVRDELGDVLFAAVNVARLASVDPELALRGSCDRFQARVERAAELAGAAGEHFDQLDLAHQEVWYRRAKADLATD